MNRIHVVTRKSVIVSVPFLLYFVASWLNMQALANLLSSFCALLSAAVLFRVSLRNHNKDFLLNNFFIFGIGCFAWGIADFAWAVLTIMGMDPSENEILWILYVMTNVSFAFGLLSTFLPSLLQWNFAQLITDMLTIILIGMVVLWEAFFQRDVALIATFFQMDYTSLASVLLDFMAIFVIFQWIASIRKGEIPQSIRLLLWGSILYFFIDLLYYHLELHELYVPNGLVDLSYSLSFLLLTWAAIYRANNVVLQIPPMNVSNVGLKQRWLIFGLVPFATVILQTTGIIEGKEDWVSILMYVLLILWNWSISKYIQLSLENRRLLRLSQTQNAMLTHRVEEQTHALSYLANKDTLTGLDNRKHFLAELEARLQLGYAIESTSLLIIDVDRLKSINEAFGTAAGDFVIIEVARRLQTLNNQQLSIARLSGDEFALLLPRMAGRDQLSAFCEHLLSQLRCPIALGNDSLEVTVSIGLATMDEHTGSAEMFLRNAEIALYQAKAQGYNRYSLYSDTINQTARSKSRIEIQLKQSDLDRDCMLLYQPQFSLPDQKLIGAEALLRWRSKEDGYIPPCVFIPIAEEIGEIYRIGEWVARNAMDQSRRWNLARNRKIRIGFNVSPVQLTAPDFLPMLEGLINQSGISTDCMDVEITESVMLDKNEQTLLVLKRIRELGFPLSVDDFGAGHASFGYLSDFPFTRIKIDRALIDKTRLLNTNEIHIIKSIINMANALGMQTIAEGVETDDQLKVLNYLGCDQVQGYYLGRPVSARQFESLFLNH